MAQQFGLPASHSGNDEHACGRDEKQKERERKRGVIVNGTEQGRVYFFRGKNMNDIYSGNASLRLGTHRKST